MLVGALALSTATVALLFPLVGSRWGSASPAPLPAATPTPPPPVLRTGALDALVAAPPLAASFALHLVRPDGTGDTLVSDTPDRPNVRWAPRGDALAWSDDSGLHAVSPGGPARRVAGQPWQFWWSPNGASLATYDGQTLRVIDLAGREAAAAPVEGEVRSLAWSPSSSAIAWTVHRTRTPYQDFRTSGASEWTLSVMSLAASAASAAVWAFPTPGTAEGGELLAWSPDEAMVLLRVEETLRRLVLRTSELTDLGTGEHAVVAPSGDAVAFTQRLSFPPCTDGVSTRLAITVLTWTTGARSTVLPHYCGLGVGPAWSPDGRWLAYDALAGTEGRGLYTVDAETGVGRRVGNADAVSSIEWAPDGEGLITRQASSGRELAAYTPIAGGRSRNLGAEPADGRPFSFGGLAQDGRRYLFADDAVRLGSVDGGEPRTIAELPYGGGFVEGGWSASQQWIAYVTRPKPSSHHALKLETGALEPRATGPDCGPPDALSVMSPDGNRRARVAWDAERQALRIIVVDNLRTGRTGLLVDGDANFQSIVWALDSRHIGYARRPNKAGEPASYGVGTVPAGTTREVATFTTEGTLIASAVAPGGAVVAFAFGDHTDILLSVEGRPGLVPVVRSAAQITCLAFTADNELLFTSAVGG